MQSSDFITLFMMAERNTSQNLTHPGMIQLALSSSFSRRFQERNADTAEVAYRPDFKLHDVYKEMILAEDKKAQPAMAASPNTVPANKPACQELSSGSGPSIVCSVGCNIRANFQNIRSAI